MRFLLSIAASLLALFFIGVLWSAGGALWSEIRVIGRAESLLSAGKWQEAADECTKALQAGPILVDRAALEGCRERAWAMGLREAQKVPNFPKAVHLTILVLGGPETGLEEEIRSLGAMLPWQHLEWIDQRLKAGEFDKVLWQCALMYQLYQEPRVLFPVRALEERVPLLAYQAMRPVAAQFLVAGDFPGLFRWLEAMRKTMASHPPLLQKVGRVQEEYTWKVFGVHAVGLSPLDGPEGVPPVEAIQPSEVSGRAALSLWNRSDRPFTVYLRGPEAYTVSIGPGAERQISLRSGEYAQLVRGKGVRPSLGVISMDGGLYRQTFQITGQDGGGR